MRDKNDVLELAIGAATLTGGTAAVLCDNAALAIVALVLGGIAYGIAIARPS